MARQIIDIGFQGNDGTGDSIREAFRKVNDNFREMYAVFGKGSQISFTDLGDAPSEYSEGQVFITDSTGTSIEARTLVGEDGVSVINDDESGTLTIKLSNGGLADTAPSLVGPLNGNNLPIAKVAVPSLEAVGAWNIAHVESGLSINIDDIVITKGYADTRYLLGGSSIPIRVRPEPTSNEDYIFEIISWTEDGSAVVADHGFTAATNGFRVVYTSTITPSTPLVSGNTYYLRYVSDVALSLHPTEEDAKNGTQKIIVQDDGSGVETLIDFYYDPALSGFWLSNEALPRSKIILKSGDAMTGFLTLHANPTSNLHAATKAYVDTMSVSGAQQSISVLNANSVSGGAYLTYDSNTGVITFNDSLISEETNEPSGFPNKVDSKISFNELTRTFTIEPSASGGEFVCWVNGIRYVFDAVLTVTIPDVTGLYYIHFNDSGVLNYKTTYFDFQTEAPVAYIYWNATANKAPFVADERHGSAMSWVTHEYLHRTRGAVFASGFSANYSLGDGTDDADAHFDLTSGTFFDEDLEVNITHSNTPIPNTFQQDMQGPGKFPIMRLSGEAEWILDEPTDFPMKQGLAGAGPEYNRLDLSDSTGVWDTVSIANGKYGISWIIATNNISYPVFSVLGQGEYDTEGEAEAVNWGNMGAVPNFPVFEYRPLYKIIYQSDSNFTNTIKAKIVSVWDIRGVTSTTITSAIVADHGALSGLSDDDHEQYVHISVARNISADHTFSGDVTFSGTISLPNSGVTSGTYTKVTVNDEGLVTSGAAATTTDISEGTNLYYTNERVDDRVSTLIQAGTNISVTYDDNANTLTISAAGAAGGGFDLSNNTTDDLDEGTNNLYFTNTRSRNAISVSGNLSYNSTTGIISYTTPTYTTTDITEGSNLYFTNARARSAISGTGLISYNSSTGVISLPAITTNDVTEDTNLYFTTARARASLSAGVGISYSSVSGTISSSITQYTDQMARDSLSGGTGILYNSSTGVISVSGLSTSDIVEGINLFFTTARARQSVSGDFGISYNSSTGVISVSGTHLATPSTVAVRDSNGDLYTSRFYGQSITPVQLLELDSGGESLTASQITSNMFSVNMSVDSYISLPVADEQTAGMRILIRNRSAYTLTILTSTMSTLTTISGTNAKEIACDGYDWFVV
jgi:hypothetical protein